MDHDSPQEGTVIESIVSVEWLARQLGNGDLVVADCRFSLADPGAGRRAYELDHIPGAIYFDLEQDLSRASGSPADGVPSVCPGDGGRHPLPSIEEMAELLARQASATGSRSSATTIKRGASQPVYGGCCDTSVTGALRSWTAATPLGERQGSPSRRKRRSPLPFGLYHARRTICSRRWKRCAKR